ncbi:hypothetical protein XU18_0264 [Perkinsela sp. CCAP 1560/4]|nr:hypothetical protein XU18_0264 [Perkinsela sp. CCAP 1560/4]|eukprot:KNH09579.1 hypothetical protein XU18_0264 [Perkinsela sp. CCAP 1560/4]
MHYEDITSALQGNTLSELVVETTACGIQLVHRMMCTALIGLTAYSPDRILYVDIDHRFDARLLRCLYERALFSQDRDREEANLVGPQPFIDLLQEKILVLHPSSYNDICAILQHISSHKRLNHPEMTGTEARLTYLVVIDSILSIPHLPYHSTPHQASPGRPTLKAFFTMLNQVATRRGICVVGVTQVYAAKAVKYMPYQSQSGGHADLASMDRFGRFRSRSDETNPSNALAKPLPWHCYVYHTEKYPREYKLDNEHYISRRILVKYRHATEVEVPQEAMTWKTQHPLHPFIGIRLGAQIEPIDLSQRADDAIIFLPDEEASHLRASFTSHVRMRIAQSPILKNVLVPTARSVEEFHQESYNELRILNSRFKQQSAVILGSSSSFVYDEVPVKSSSAFDVLPASLHQTGPIRGHSRPLSHLRPPYHTTAEMMRFIGGY